MSSLRKQGPITTDLRCWAKASDNVSQHNRHGVWVPAFAGTTAMGYFKHTFSSSRRVAPESCMNLGAPRSEGAGNAGRDVRTRSLACKVKKHTS